MAYTKNNPYNQGIGNLDLSQYGLIQPDNNINNQQANWINTLSGGMFGTTDEQDAQNAALEQIQEIRKNQFEGYPSGTNAEWVEEYKGNYPDLYKEYQNKQNQIQQIKDQHKGVEAIDQASLVNEYGYPLMANLSGAVPKRVSTTQDIDIDSLQNEMVGPNPHDPSVYDPYGNIQMALEDEDFYENPKGLAQLFQNLDPSAWGTALKNKASTGWSLAKQLPGMAMSALGGMPGAAMGLLSKLGKPDTPYQKFQKQMFEDMGWQGESNKDPWGKNINSAFGDYDVTEQWGDLMGSKLGQNYGYADAFADGVLDDAELAKMQDLGLKGWQLNRAIGLSTAAKNAQNWKDKKEQEKIITNQMKNINTGGGKTTTYTPPTKQGTTGSWTPGGTYQGVKSSPKGYSARSHSGGQYGGQHHWARGGRVGYANGGLASLFTRRG